MSIPSMMSLLSTCLVNGMNDSPLLSTEISCDVRYRFTMLSVGIFISLHSIFFTYCSLFLIVCLVRGFS